MVHYLKEIPISEAVINGFTYFSCFDIVIVIFWISE